MKIKRDSEGRIQQAQFFSWDYYACHDMAAGSMDICVLSPFPNEITAQLHFHDFYSLVFVQDPKVAMCINGDVMDNLAGKALLFQPRTLHAILGEAPQFSSEQPLYVILVREELIKKKLLSILTDIASLSDFFLGGILSDKGEYIVLDIADSPDILTTVQLILQENESIHDCVSQQILETQFLLLLLRLSRIQDQMKKKRRTGRLKAEDILRYISAHPQDVTLQSLSYHFNYHPNYIAQILRKEAGGSFTELKHYFQLKNACSLLETTSYPVQTVAFLVGFENVHYFYRIFKKSMGVTPLEYRKSSSSL